MCGWVYDIVCVVEFMALCVWLGVLSYCLTVYAFVSCFDTYVHTFNVCGERSVRVMLWMRESHHFEIWWHVAL